jgi:hypothetical protein
MEKNKKEEATLLWQFLPFGRRKMKAYFDDWKEFVCEPYMNMNVEEWQRIEFKGKHGYKSIIYRDLARALINGWVYKDDIGRIARYLAKNTNINSNPNQKTRVKTICQGINRKKKYLIKISGQKAA